MISDFGDIEISESKSKRIGIGGGAFFNSFTWGTQDTRESIRTIEYAIDLGISFIDTGESYGKGMSERVIGKAIKGKRSRVLVASKISEKTLESNDIHTYEQACDNSLSRLEIDCIDLYQIHWINPQIDIDTVIEGLKILKSKGKVRNVGICNCGKIYSDYFPDDFITNQMPYSLLWRGMEYEYGETLEECKKIKLFYYGLGQGLLGTKYENLTLFPRSRQRTRLFNYENLNARHKECGHEEALINFLDGYHRLCREYGVLENHAAICWLLQRTENSLAIVGLRNQAQVKEICSIEKVDEEFIRKLTNISDKLKDDIGYKLDLWDANERIR